MFTFKRTIFGFALAAVAVFAAYALQHSALEPQRESPPLAVSKSPSSPSSPSSASEYVLEDSFPAPAKKIHEILSDTTPKIQNNKKIDESMAQVDESLKLFRQRLDLEEVSPGSLPQEISEDSQALRSRLSVMREHIKARKQDNK